MASSLKTIADDIGKDWKARDSYYDEAEATAQDAWDVTLWPHLEGLDSERILEIAPGHGRFSMRLRKLCQSLTLVDINEENLIFCRERFAGDDAFQYIQTDGFTLPGVEDVSLDLVFSWDSMVHFDSDIIRAYLGEIQRVLKPGGHAVLHHSNYTANPGGDFRENPHWRNFMSAPLFAHYAIKAGLQVEKQHIFKWEIPELDCLSVLKKA